MLQTYINAIKNVHYADKKEFYFILLFLKIGQQTAWLFLKGTRISTISLHVFYLVQILLNTYARLIYFNHWYFEQWE